MSDPTVSVVVIAHRRTEYLEDALRSVEQQRRPPDEVLVIEDNPPYGRPSVVPPARPVSWENRGDLGPAGAKFARGLATARGEVVAFLEDDDRFVPEKLAHVARVFGDHPEVVFLRNRLAFIGPDGAPRAATSPIRAHPEGPVPPVPSAMSRGLMTLNMSAMSVRRRAYLPALSFYGGENPSSDVLTYWLSAYLGGTAWYSPLPLTEYRFHDRNLSRSNEVDVTLRSYAFARQLVAASAPGSPARALARSIERSQRLGAAMASGRLPTPSELSGQLWDGVVRLSAIHFLRLYTVYRHWRQIGGAVRPSTGAAG